MPRKSRLLENLISLGGNTITRLWQSGGREKKKPRVSGREEKVSFNRGPRFLWETNKIQASGHSELERDPARSIKANVCMKVGGKKQQKNGERNDGE